ncbi:MAG: DUF2780 domain-containing protein [Pyrinomonadaceae bacterium]
MKNRTRITLVAAALLALLGTAGAQLPSPKSVATKPPSPELIGNLTKGLSIKPEQAIGGAGALFGLAKTKLKPADFAKLADAVPGMDGFLKAAPKTKQEGEGGTADMLSSVGSMLPGKAGAIASVAGAFNQLGMSPETAVKFVPIMTKFVDLKGGASAAKLLSGVLK